MNWIPNKLRDLVSSPRSFDYERYLLQLVSDTATPADQRAHAVDELRLRDDTRTTLTILCIIFVVSLVLTAIAQPFLAWGQARGSVLFGSALLAGLWGVAWSLGGAVTGFLFGIPHTQQAPAGANAVAPAYSQRVNTNLEEISDWLTKIIVGIGLVQLLKLPPYLGLVANYMAHCGICCPPFAMTVLIAFLAEGFLLGYLATRMYLAPAFGRADRASTAALDLVKTLPKALPGRQPDEPTARPSEPHKAALLASIPPTPGETFDQTYARARLLADQGQFAQAAQIYATLVQRSPDDPTLRLEYAWTVFKSIGVFSDLIETQLKHVLSLDQRLTQEARLTREARRDLYESLTFYYLYKEPDGYGDSIRYGETYLALPTHLTSAEIYVNLACAYGQAHRHATALQDKSELRLKALNCVKQAIKLNPDKAKPLREQLLGTTSGENDLNDFISDTDFRSTLGLN